MWYSEKNFVNYFGGTSFQSKPICTDTTEIRNSRSVRHLGPRDSSIPALSVYAHDYASGTEQIFTTRAASNFGFTANYAVASGYSSWTLYYNADFTGNSTCLSSKGTIIGKSVVFRSAVMGCSEQCIQYFYRSW
ncbi:hypothetical protein Fcan01_19324 [Folsomia candida]|uniref:Uncharacterized protein n=1 Tax=Folsomia candida TaxID=158441 RepID=A0A226DM39_FOLCA|nr:hypothetical protein Fcan01_19324 [Folsomia candida]